MGKSVKYPWQFYFVLAIPVINAIASNTTDYFRSDVINSGNLRALIIGLFALYFIFSRLPNERLYRFVLLYLIYYGLLVLFATDRLHSGNLYLKFFIEVIMLPIGYYFINSIERFKMLVQILFITLVLHLVNIATANIFILGTSDYLDQTFYFGAGRVNITKNILVLVFMLPVTLLFIKRYRKVVLAIYIIGFLIAIIGIKRSVLISSVAGVITYLLAKRRVTLMVRTALVVAGLGLVLLLAFPRFVGLFRERFNARNERVELTEETIESEGRISEVVQVFNAWKSGSFKHKLIGSELFNDRLYFNSKRMLHTDYMIILNGSGLIGFVLWFYMFARLIREKNRYYKFLHNHILFRELNAIFWVLIITQLVFSLAGTIYAIELRSLIFLIWGASLGTMKGYLLRKSTYKAPVPINSKNIAG